MEDDIESTTLVGMPSKASSPNPEREIHTRKYQRQGSDWVLSEDRSESESDDANGHRRTVSVATFSNVKFHKNPERDAKRHALRPSTDWMPRAQSAAKIPQASSLASTRGESGGFTPGGALAVPDRPNRMIVCDDDCIAAGSPAYTPPTAPLPMGSDPQCFADVAATVNPAPASLNILYQHGFGSSATTWCQMSRYVRERFRVGNEIRHSLNARASYEDQAADLENRFRSDAASYPGPYVLIGHSNGGLINRYMAQQVSDPALIRGVVTVSSPHAGVYLANTTERVLVGVLAIPFSGYFMGCDVANAFVCTHGTNVAGQVALALAPVLASAAFPVLQEMGTNAPFHNTINARGDATYRVAGVQNRVWDRWTMWRLLADYQRCPDGYVACDDYSRNYVNAVDKNYHHFINCAIVSGILGIVWPGSRRAAAACAKNAAWLKVADEGYKRLTVGNGHGDAVVPEFSQLYPGAPANLQYLVDDSDSHLGETRSRFTARGILNAINTGMGIPFDQ